MDGLTATLAQEFGPWTLLQLAEALGFILAGFILRAIVNSVVAHRLVALAEKTETKADDIASKALVSPLGLILPVVGIYLAVRTLLSVHPEWLATSDKVFMVVTILVITWTAFKMVDAATLLMKELAQKTDSRLDDHIVPLVRKALKTFMGLLAFILIAQNLGYSVSGLLAGLGMTRLARYGGGEILRRLRLDLAVILAFYLPLPVILDLRILRIFRLLSILRITHYSRPLQILVAVLKHEWRTLLALLTLLVSLLLITAWLMYMVEREAQPDAFGSIPQALWWGMATLTTVGYGDVVPLTTEGKFLGFLIMFIGIGMFAVPTGILVATFIQEVKRKDFVATWNMVAHVPFFSGLTAQEIAGISDLLKLRTSVPGEVIFEKGDEGDAMYFIVSGEAEMSFESLSKVFRGGDFFG